jgi:hypothetical protein
VSGLTEDQQAFAEWPCEQLGRGLKTGEVRIEDQSSRVGWNQKRLGVDISLS